jgi:hypothetical protein
MDDLIRRFDAARENDLMLCHARGVAYQRDMSSRVSYDADYFDKCAGYEGQEIARKINAGRVALVNKHAGADCEVIDIGVGSGEFIRSRPNTFGYDINPKAAAWLKSEGRWRQDFTEFSAFTFWDVLEHVDAPQVYFKRIRDGGFVFVCLPIFSDLNRIRESRHYRPGEHFYYWTERGLIDWMAQYRFEMIDRQDYETTAGRDSIVSFAFKRSLPSYHATIDQYRKLYAPYYGASAYLYFDEIAQAVKALNPMSILDYGCGRSDLVAHFWNDGARRIAKYDPAIPPYEMMPEGRFELALCCDVMEHILMHDVDRVLREIKTKADRALFTISLRPARAKLPDGRNAHVTLLTEGEWTRWIGSIFGHAIRVPLQWDHILMLKTW